jgi:hypothetical protein
MGYVDIGGAKVELLLKDFTHAQQIMRDHGYEVSGETDEIYETGEIDETEKAEIYAEYKRNKAKLSKTMAVFVLLLVIVLAILIFLNKYSAGS